MKGVLFALLTFSLLAAAATGFLYLDEKVVLGVVTDEQSGLPLAGTLVTIGETVQVSDAGGRFRFQGLKGTLPVSIQAEGYLEAKGEIEVRGLFKKFPLEVVLRPNLLIGTVRDEETGEPIPEARISTGQQVVGSDGGGRFVILRLAKGTSISIVALGYEPGEVVFRGGEEIQEVFLQPRITAVEVRDEKGVPIIEAVVSAGEEVAEGSPEGVFLLRRLQEGAQISVLAEGYYGVEVTYEGLSPLEVVLERSRVTVEVYDLYTGQPLPGALLSWGDDSFSTDAQGQSQIDGVKAGERFQLAAEGYEGGEVAYGGEAVLEVALRPNTLQGVVRDERTGAPIPEADIQVGERLFHTDAQGNYYITDLPAQAILTFSAPGFKEFQVILPRSTTLDVALEPVKPVEDTSEAKGIYIAFGLLAYQDKVEALLDMVARTELNAIVVDVKADSGRLAYHSEDPLALEIGAEQKGWMDIQELLRLCQEQDIYTIARLVVFKDSVLARARQDWAVKRPDETPFADGRGSLWVDPFREEVWEYNIAIAREVAALGFDELQFDYIRFPTNGETGSLVYSQPSTAESRYGTLQGFMARMDEALEPLGVLTSADIFGLTAWLDHEANIGQMIENVAPYVDYLSPMLYPSTFTPGLLNWGPDKKPTEYPYEVVYESLVKIQGRTDKPLRPWLQHYSDYQYHLPFGLEEYQAQKQATYDAGVYGWLFWNANGIYEEALFESD